MSGRAVFIAALLVAVAMGVVLQQGRAIDALDARVAALERRADR